MADVLLQTRVPQRIGQWVDARARAAGLSVAGWLRNHLIMEAQKMFVEAQTVARDDTNKSQRMQVAEYYLERSREFSGSERAFWLLHGPASDDEPGTPVSPERWARTRTDVEVQMLLKGSNKPWSVVGTMFDEATQRIEITLRANQ